MNSFIFRSMDSHRGNTLGIRWDRRKVIIYMSRGIRSNGRDIHSFSTNNKDCMILSLLAQPIILLAYSFSASMMQATVRFLQLEPCNLPRLTFPLMSFLCLQPSPLLAKRFLVEVWIINWKSKVAFGRAFLFPLSSSCLINWFLRVAFIIF